MRCPACARVIETASGRCTWCGASLADDETGAATVIPPPALRGDAGGTLGGSALDGQTAVTGVPPGLVNLSRSDSDGDTTLEDLAEPATRLSDLPPRAPSAPAHGAGGGLLRPGEAFGPRYHIIRELGVGGMGAVYHAWDDELGVGVALKLIRPSAGDPAAARELELRFKRELLLARQVTHRNVVRIHDLGEVDGIKYITMPYVEGSDLSQILDTAVKLPVERTLAIARQVASGLRAAHDVGIVHRDLKPANIMIEGDAALIMDFGIARSVGSPRMSAVRSPAIAPPIEPPASPLETMIAAASSTGPVADTQSPLTMVGGVVGTIQYMAPEQARAQPVDHRADIYAFGLIVYDLLVGRQRQSHHESSFAELMSRLDKAPPALRTLDASIPEAVEAIVQRCLQPDPEQRYATTADLVAALDALDEHGHLLPEPEPITIKERLSVRAMSAIALLVVALLGGTFWFASRNATPPAQPPPVSVLVADFLNPANDADFDGVLEQALEVGVEGASFVSIYPRRDALRLAGQLTAGSTVDAEAARLIALREGVGRVLTGAIEPDGTRYRLAVTLFDPVENQALQSWSAQAADKEGVLDAIADLAMNVRRGLGDAAVSAGDARRAEESFTAASLDAARAYSAGQEHLWAGRYEQAYASFQEAVKLDPDMGRAYSGLGVVANNLGRADQAEEYFKQALSRLERMTDREKYRTRGVYYLLIRNPEKAREELQALVKEFPADSAGLSNLAMAEFYRRDMNAAVDLGTQASALLPRNVQRKNNAALFAMYAGDFATAEQHARGVLEINPEFPKAHLAIALSQLAAGKPDEAHATYSSLQKLPGLAAWLAASGLADLAMYRGRLAEADNMLASALASEQDASRRARLTATLAELRLSQGRPREAANLARQAIAATTDEGIQFLAARIAIQAGQREPGLAVAAALGKKLDRESQSYAALLEGEAALMDDNPRVAIDRFTAATQAADSWLARFGLGRAYLAGGAFAEADSEFDICLRRRGEATAVLLDDVASYRFFAPTLYYKARVQEGLLSPAATATYREFLALKQNGDEQGLVADARRRLEAR